MMVEMKQRLHFSTFFTLPNTLQFSCAARSLPPGPLLLLVVKLRVQISAGLPPYSLRVSVQMSPRRGLHWIFHIISPMYLLPPNSWYRASIWPSNPTPGLISGENHSSKRYMQPYVHRSNMDGPRDCHTEWNKSDRERQIAYDIAYMWNLKKGYKWTYPQNRNRVTVVENKLMLTRGKRGVRDKMGDWDWHIHTTIYIVDN